MSVIITAANTVSRASAAVSEGSPDTISVTIGPTSMTHGQHERPERLADAVRDHLRVVDGRQRRCDGPAHAG